MLPLARWPISVVNRFSTTSSSLSTTFTAAGLANRSLLMHLIGITGAHASCRAPKRMFVIILLIVTSVGVKVRLGNRSFMSVPGPPKKLSRAAKITAGSITARDVPDRGLRVTVLSAEGEFRLDIYSLYGMTLTFSAETLASDRRTSKMPALK